MISRFFEFDALHRIMTGQALTPKQLRWGGVVILIWFMMDVLQFFRIDGITILGWFWQALLLPFGS